MKHRRQPTALLNIRGSEVEHLSSFKLLGVHIIDDGTPTHQAWLRLHRKMPELSTNTEDSTVSSTRHDKLLKMHRWEHLHKVGQCGTAAVLQQTAKLCCRLWKLSSSPPSPTYPGNSLKQSQVSLTFQPASTRKTYRIFCSKISCHPAKPATTRNWS